MTMDTEKYHDEKLIQRFHDYQVEWLYSHYDLEFEPQLEKLVIHFLHDTSKCFILEEKG